MGNLLILAMLCSDQHGGGCSVRPSGREGGGPHSQAGDAAHAAQHAGRPIGNQLRRPDGGWLQPTSQLVPVASCMRSGEHLTSTL